VVATAAAAVRAGKFLSVSNAQNKKPSANVGGFFILSDFFYNELSE